MSYYFFFNDTATTEIYTHSLHDALPIWHNCDCAGGDQRLGMGRVEGSGRFLDIGEDRPTARGEDGVGGGEDRKSTRLNSSHANISYAVFCLKKKIKNNFSTYSTNKF